MEKFNPYHQHLLVKCWVTNPPKKEEQLNKWFINLVETVGMKVVAGPTCGMLLDERETLHVWGKWKNSGDGGQGTPWMYPKYFSGRSGDSNSINSIIFNLESPTL